MPTVRLLIRGKVQGVFYRASSKEMAAKLGVKGWIKNNADDSVEARVTGTDEQIQQFMAWCRKGPRRAEVAQVIMTRIENENFTDFAIVG
jgi:acylphosphatase